MSIIKELKLFSKNLSLLVVEDQKDLNEELVELTSLFFQKVDFAYDGVEALEKYKKSKYDLVLSDITMPNMNGVKLSREIKHINSDQSIIILSAHNELEYLIDLIDIGIHQFVAKPFKEEELFYRLLKVCENIVYKEHYMNSIKKEHTISKEVEKEVDDFLEENEELISESDYGLEPNNYNIDIDKNVSSLVKHEIIDANNFLTNLQNDELVWNVMEEQIEQLLELSSDFNDCIERIYLNKLNQNLIADISVILRGIYSIFSFMETLKSLGDVLNDLSIFLENLNFDSLEKTQVDKLKMLEFIYDDVSRFIQTVFVYKDTLDVHYLEDSLRSSVQQLKINVLSQEIEEDELELF